MKRLLDDCKKQEVEMIVTKSVSRFGRNTVETLKICRQLKDIDVDVYFHNENLHSISKDGELALTLASAIAEGESASKSESVKWGIEKKAMAPDAGIYSRPCYGYKKDDDGKLVIVEDEAEVVRHIYQMYLDGSSVNIIKGYLEEQGVLSPTGGVVWSKRTIEKMLINDKYYGSVILYKTYTAEFPSDKRITNNGQRKKYQVDDHHPAIVSKELFDAVQKSIESRRYNKK
nr:recombinase family protein [Duncaniella freteri]